MEEHMSKELNEATAKQLTSEIAACSCEACQTAIAGRIFTALQIAQKRGEVIAGVKIKELERQIEALESDNVDAT
jgi:hypothetical protein